MQHYIVHIIGCSLALFGFFKLITGIGSILLERSIRNCSNIKTVMVVKNCDDIIEYTIRSYMKRIIRGKSPYDFGLTVLDMGSDDETFTILEKLKNEYEYLEVLGKKEKEKIFEGFLMK